MNDKTEQDPNKAFVNNLNRWLYVEGEPREEPDISFQLNLGVVMKNDGGFTTELAINTSEIPQYIKFLEKFEKFDMDKGLGFYLNGETPLRVIKDPKKPTIKKLKGTAYLAGSALAAFNSGKKDV